MSRIFGEVRQIAFVVRDLDAALRYWTATVGVGPFFVLRNLVPGSFRYRGAASTPPRMSIALANSGELQVEIIEQHDDHPSAYRDSLARAGEGFQHVSSWVTREEYDARYEKLVAAGVPVAHEGTIPGNDVRFVYFATDSAPGGLVYEMADVLEPPVRDMMAAIRDAARGWDGSDPIRELG